MRCASAGALAVSTRGDLLARSRLDAAPRPQVGAGPRSRRRRDTAWSARVAHGRLRDKSQAGSWRALRVPFAQPSVCNVCLSSRPRDGAARARRARGAPRGARERGRGDVATEVLRPLSGPCARVDGCHGMCVLGLGRVAALRESRVLERGRTGGGRTSPHVACGVSCRVLLCTVCGVRPAGLTLCASRWYLLVTVLSTVVRVQSTQILYCSLYGVAPFIYWRWPYPLQPRCVLCITTTTYDYSPST